MADAPQHLVRSYEQELNQLRGLIVEMGGIVESQVGWATHAVIDRNAETSTRAIAADAKVDALERDIEQFVIRLIARRQPMAGDLRLIIGGLKASDDLERIGDHASNVAKRATVLSRVLPSFCLASLAHMADLVRQNLHQMVAALRDADPAVAAKVWRADQAVDDMYNAVFRELMTYMLEDSRNITPCTHLLFVARILSASVTIRPTSPKPCIMRPPGKSCRAHGRRPIATCMCQETANEEATSVDEEAPSGFVIARTPRNVVG